MEVSDWIVLEGVVAGFVGRRRELAALGQDREPVARQLLFLGSVKWLETAPFDDHDLVELQRHRDRVTSEPLPLIAISRSGTATSRADAVFSPECLIEAWLPS